MFNFKLIITLVLRRLTSVVVRVSALAIIGMMLTLVWSAFIHSISRGFKPCPHGEMK